MELFNMYVDEFNTIASSIRTGIEGAEDVPKLNELEKKFEELDANLKQMGIEAAGIRGTEKRNCTDKISDCRDQYAQLKGKFSDKKFTVENKHLMGTKSGDDRYRMKKVTDKAADSNELLIRSIQQVEQMNTESDMIMEELQSNSERIKSSQAKADEVKGMMDPALKTIKRMDRRRWTLGFF